MQDEADLHQGKMPGKNTLPTYEWESGKIEATPHGFAAKLFDKSIAEAQMTQAEKAQRLVSSFCPCCLSCLFVSLSVPLACLCLPTCADLCLFAYLCPSCLFVRACCHNCPKST